MKINTRFKRIMLMMLFVLFVVPSTIFAATGNMKNIGNATYDVEEEKFTVNGAVYDGTHENPIPINLDYDEFIISYANGTDDAKIKYPFYFEIKRGSTHPDFKYAKYTVNIISTEKKVVFKRIAATDEIDTFLVLPNQKTTTINFVQPGGIYNEHYNYSLFTPPLYKIVSMFEFGDGKIIETVLGNTTLKSSGDTGYTSGDATDSKTYVFCVTDNMPENQAVSFTPQQQGSAIVTVKTLVRRFIFFTKEEAKTYKATSANTIQNLTSREHEVYTFNGNNSRITYAFWGLTSDVLTDNEVTKTEEVLSKILLSVGGMFRAVVTAIGGNDLTLDALIFNQYKNTILDFWEGSGTYTDVFRLIINGWYNAFRSWTSVVLIVILVAMGVKTLLYAGTAKQKKIQNMLVGWVLAVALLYLGPYFMKYAVSINDAFVKSIRDQSKYSVYSVYNADFLSEYNLSGEMQVGEDSETVKLQETLQQLYNEIDRRMQEAENALQRASGEIAELEGDWGRVSDDDWQQLIIYDDVSGEWTFDQTKLKMDELIAERKTIPSEEIDLFVKKNVHSINIAYDSSWDAFNRLLEATDARSEQKLLEKLQTQLNAYTQAQSNINKYAADLAATEKAIDLANKGIDLETQMKDRAGQTYRIVYVAVWYLMIYQLVLLLFMYYKRLVVVGVLITIYPLVIMVYAIEKLMDIENPKSLKTWLTEYLVNIFIQAVHALLYVMLIEAGLAAFEQDPDNWLLFLVAVLAIFPMENIVRSILGMKASSVSTLVDGAKKSAKLAATVAVAGSMMGSNKQIDAKYDLLDAKAAKKAATADKTASFLKNAADNRVLKGLKGGASAEDALRILKQSDEMKKARDARVAKKRAASQRVRDRRRKLEKVTQPLKNLHAIESMITTGLAGGGDADDFAVGAAIGGAISGKNRKYGKPQKDNSSGKTLNGQAKNKRQGKSGSGNTNNNNSNSHGNGGGSSKPNPNNPSPTPSQPASAPDYGNGRNTQTYGEKRAADRRANHSAELQNAFRDKIASKRVNAGTPDYTYSEFGGNGEEE